MQRGFTLIEMLVSVAIFTIVMTIALGALLMLSEADRKAESINSAVNNLSFALDSMSRAIRTGLNYHCGSGGVIASPQDCAAGANSFAFLATDGSEVLYSLGTNTCQNGIGCILRSTDGGSTYLPITSPEVVITNLQFFAIGTTRTDTLQPKATILASGYVTVGGLQQSAFNLQTSITQRLYDQ